jgi:hypothetical protein
LARRVLRLSRFASLGSGQTACKLCGEDWLENMAQANLFVAVSMIETSAESLFHWHAEPGALERSTPPWEKVEIIERARGIRHGDRGAMLVCIGPFRVRWTFEHRNYIEGRQFRDVQTAGLSAAGSIHIYLWPVDPSIR